MGYSTDFKGRFDLNKELDYKTYKFLTKLANTRRIKRKLMCLPDYGFEQYGFDSWGEEGEFYVNGGGYAGQNNDSSVLNYNYPPCSQPSLWCQWIPTKDHIGIEWDGSEKFYCYKEWLQYIVDRILKPRGYELSGVVSWQGEESNDYGQLKADGSTIYTRKGIQNYGTWE